MPNPFMRYPVTLSMLHDLGDASCYCGAGYAELQANVSGAVAWPSAGRGFFIPVYLLAPMVVTEMVWRNGASVSGTIDVGIYNRNGVRMVSAGPTTMAGTNVLQSVAVAITLFPELYYLAMSASGTPPIWRWSAGTTLGPPLLRSIGVRVQESVTTLPAVATFSDPQADYLPLIVAGGRILE